jgi:hypothetical protein
MKRKKNQIGALTLLIVAALFFALPMRAQVTIGSQQTPDANALLDLKQDGTANKGLLLPRVALVALNDPSPLANHVKGMLVYNNGTAVPEGIYYDDGNQWVATTGGQATPRLLIKELSTAGNYTISVADDNYLIVTTAETVFTFPTDGTFTAADAGIIVRIINLSGTTNTYNGTQNSASNGSSNGGIFVWTGKIWVALSKQ